MAFPTAIPDPCFPRFGDFRHNKLLGFPPSPRFVRQGASSCRDLSPLFTGQWADLPLEDLAKSVKNFGYDGLELACWGDHFEVDKALAEPDYCASRRELLERYDLQRLGDQQSPGRPGGAGRDRRAAQGDPAAARLGRRQSGRRQCPRRRGNEEHGPRGAEAGRERGQRLHRLEHLAVALFVSAGLAGDDRRRLQAAGRALEPDSRRLRRVRREVRAWKSIPRKSPSISTRPSGPWRPSTAARSSASISIPAI